MEEADLGTRSEEGLGMQEPQELEDQAEIDHEATAAEGVIEEGTFLDEVMLEQDRHDLPTIVSAGDFTEDDSFTVEPPLGEENRYIDHDDEIGLQDVEPSSIQTPTMVFPSDTSLDADMSQVSFDSANYASNQGMTQWELFLQIADEKRGFLPGDNTSLAPSVSTSQFTIQDKEQMEKAHEKETKELSNDIESLQARIKRRNVIINTMREAYLKDVIELKTVMFSVLTESERLRVVNQWEASIPSMDFRKPIELCAPDECDLTFSPCETCGGTLEIYHRQSSRMIKLEKSLAEYRERQEELYANNALQKTLVERTEEKMANLQQAHNDEKKYIYGELKKSKDHVADLEKEIVMLKGRNRHLVSENNKLNEDNRDMKQIKDELREAEKQLFQQTENNKILTDRAKKYEGKMNDLEEEIESIRRESVQTLKKFNDEKETTLQLRKDLREAHDSLAEANGTIQDKVKDISSREKDIEDIQAKVRNLEDTVRNDNVALESTVDKYEKSLEELKSELQISYENIEDLTEKVYFQKTQHEGSQMCYEDLLVKTSNLEHNLEVLDLELEDKEDEIDQLKTLIEELNARSRPNSRLLRTGNEGLGADLPHSKQSGRGNSASGGSGELSERETNMVKALHALQGQLSNLQAQHQSLQQQIEAQGKILNSQNESIKNYQKIESEHAGNAMKLKLITVKLESKRKELDEVTIKNINMEAELSNCNKVISDLKMDLKSAKEMHDKAMEAHAKALESQDIDDVINVYKEEIRALEEKLSTKQKEMEDGMSKIVSLDGDLLVANKRVEDLTIELLSSKENAGKDAQLSADLEDLKSKILDSENELKLQTSKNQKSREELEAVMKLSNELQGEKVVLKGQLDAVVANVSELQKEFDEYKQSTEKSLADATPDAIKQMFEDRICALENKVLESKKELEIEKNNSRDFEGKYVALQGSIDHFHEMISSAEEEKANYIEKNSVLTARVQELQKFERDLAEVTATKDKLARELAEAQKDLDTMINTKDTAPSNDEIFSKEELMKIEEEAKKEVQVVSAPQPQVIVTEIVCSVCREKQTAAKMEAEATAAKVDTSQWDSFLPTESESRGKSGSRVSSRRSRISQDSKDSNTEKQSAGNANVDKKTESATSKRAPEVVDLLPVSTTAYNEELTLRDDILMGLSTSVGPMQAKKAANGIHDVLEHLGNILHSQAEAQWKWMTLGKRAIDMYPILLKITNGIVDCMENGRSEDDVKRVNRIVSNTIDKNAIPPTSDMVHLENLYVEEGPSEESLKLTEKCKYYIRQEEKAFEANKQEKEELIERKKEEAIRIADVDEEGAQILNDECSAIEFALMDDLQSHQEKISKMDAEDKRRRDAEMEKIKFAKTQWDNLIKSMTPSEQKFLPYSEFFGDGTGDFIYQRSAMIEQTFSAHALFESYLSDITSYLLEALPKIVDDWGAGKTTMYKLSSMLEETRKKQQVIGDQVAADLRKELKTMTKKFTSAKEGRKEAEKRTAGLQAELDELQIVEKRLQEANQQITDLKGKIADLETKLDDKNERLGEVLLEKNELTTTLADTTTKLMDLEQEMKDARARMAANTQMMAQEHKEKVLAQDKYDKIVEAEKERIAGQRSVACQRIIEHNDISIQTEFASTDVNIVTTVSSLEKDETASIRKLDRRRQFPLAVTLPGNATKLDNTLNRPIFGRNKMTISKQISSSLSEADISRIAKLTRDFAMHREMSKSSGLADGGLGQLVPQEVLTAPLTENEKVILTKRTEIARLRAIVAKETRAKEKPGVEGRMKKAMEEKIVQKRVEINHILSDIAKLEEKHLPCHSFDAEETESNDAPHNIPAGPGAVRGVSTPMSDSTELTKNYPGHYRDADGESKDFLQQDVDFDGRVRIRSPPPHTPQSPYTNNSPQSLGGYSGDLGPLSFENTLGERRKVKSSKKVSLGPVIHTYQHVRSEIEEGQHMAEAMMTASKNSTLIPNVSISQSPLIPQKTKRIRFDKIPSASLMIGGDSDSDSQSQSSVQNRIRGYNLDETGRKMNSVGLNEWIEPHEFVKKVKRKQVSHENNALNLGEGRSSA